MKRGLLTLGLLAIMLSSAWAAVQSDSAKTNDSVTVRQHFKERGRYIYDERGLLPLESQLSLSAYLWQLDVKTGYEVVVIIPRQKLDEAAIIKYFNAYGVGKAKKDNGAALFIFPDNTFFLAIGSGNDRVSVTMAKTYGEKALKDFSKDPVLSILRFVHSLDTQITTPTVQERAEKFGQKVLANIDLIFLWLLVLALIVFLVQQFDGFQWHDLILPGLLVVGTLIFTGICAVSKSESFETYHEYGIIINTEHSTYHWVQTVVISNGKTTTTMLIPHTDYRNDVTTLSYNLETYHYRYTTTDHKGAWDHVPGEFNVMVVGVTTGALWGYGVVEDLSGGKTIGDGVWLKASP